MSAEAKEYDVVDLVPLIGAHVRHTCEIFIFIFIVVVAPQQPPREPQVPVAEHVRWELGGAEESEGSYGSAGSASEGVREAGEGGSEGIHNANGGYEPREAAQGRGS